MSKPSPNKLAKGKHESVAAMVRDYLEDDPEFVTELSSQLGERQMVKALAVLRARAMLSQKDLASKANCQQPRISKLESGLDADIRYGDILAYLKATDHEARIFFIPSGETLANEVKFHAGMIHRLLARMVGLAGRDASIVKGVASFIEEAHQNLAHLTELAARSLPAESQPPPPRIVEVEAPQFAPEVQPENQSPPSQKPKRRRPIH